MGKLSAARCPSQASVSTRQWNDRRVGRKSWERYERWSSETNQYTFTYEGIASQDRSILSIEAISPGLRFGNVHNFEASVTSGL